MVNSYDLQLFADEGAAVGDTGVTADVAGQQSEAIVSSGEASQGETGQDAAVQEETFESLITGRYKKDFNDRVNRIVQGRLSRSKADTELVSKLEPMLQLVARGYGMSIEDLRSADIDTLSAHIMDDNRFYEEMAEERGFTADQMRKVYQTEQRAQLLERAETQRQQEAEKQQQWGQILQQAEALRGKYASFDLNKEMSNEQFARMVAVGVPLEAAYTAMHHTELANGAMQFAAQETARRISSSIAAGAKRPREAGLSAQAGAQAQPKVNYTKKDIDSILARVRRGEKVTL